MEEFQLEPGEQVVRTVRKHWFVFLLMLLPYAFLAVVPFVLPWMAGWALRFAPDFSYLLSSISLNQPFIRLGLGIWWLLLWIGAFNAFTSYFLNVWVVTSRRIVRIHQAGFFNRVVSSFLLHRVQDVTTTVDGFFADVLSYGSVRVETAGTASDNFSMDGVADPVAMRDVIMREITLLQHAGDQV